MVVSILSFAKCFVDFSRYTIGTIQTPYETYRRLSLRRDSRIMFCMALVIFLTLGILGLVKGGLGAHPFLLTASFTKIVMAILLSFMVSVTLVGFLGGIVGGDVHWMRIMVLWAMSLWPTSVWFLSTALFSFILPPPRTMSVWGQLASAVFIGLSASLFFWKGILYYLTLRFGLRIGLSRILIISAVFLPALVLYSIGMYRLGIFRVPFL